MRLGDCEIGRWGDGKIEEIDEIGRLRSCGDLGDEEMRRLGGGEIEEMRRLGDWGDWGDEEMRR